MNLGYRKSKAKSKVSWHPALDSDCVWWLLPKKDDAPMLRLNPLTKEWEEAGGREPRLPFRNAVGWGVDTFSLKWYTRGGRTNRTEEELTCPSPLSTTNKEDQDEPV